MAQPAPRGAVATDVREAVLVEAIRRAEGNLFDRLIHEQTLREKEANESTRVESL